MSNTLCLNYSLPHVKEVVKSYGKKQTELFWILNKRRDINISLANYYSRKIETGNERKRAAIFLLKDEIKGNATSYLELDNTVFIPFNPSKRIKTKNQSIAIAKNIVEKINKKYKEGVLSLEIPSDANGTFIYVNPSAKLSREIVPQTFFGEQGLLFSNGKPIPNTNNKQSIEEGLAWAKKVFAGDVNIKFVEGLIKGVANGSYNSITELIKISADFGNKGTIKHEMGHKFFSYLSPAEKNAILDEGAKLFNIKRGVSEVSISEETGELEYSEGDLKIEEEIMLLLEKSPDTIKPGNAISKFFNDIVKFLKSIFKNKNKIEDFINNVNAGNFKYLKPYLSEIDTKDLSKIKEGNLINKLLYRSVYPYGYSVSLTAMASSYGLVAGRDYQGSIDFAEMLYNKGLLKKKVRMTRQQYNNREDAWRLSNGLEQLNNTFKFLGVNEKNERVYTFNDFKFIKEEILDAYKGELSVDTLNNVMGNFYFKTGEDENGLYVEYSDVWDLDVKNSPIINTVINLTQQPFLLTGKIYSALTYDENGNEERYLTLDAKDVNIKEFARVFKAVNLESAEKFSSYKRESSKLFTDNDILSAADSFVGTYLRNIASQNIFLLFNTDLKSKEDVRKIFDESFDIWIKELLVNTNISYPVNTNEYKETLIERTKLYSYLQNEDNKQNFLDKSKLILSEISNTISIEDVEKEEKEEMMSKEKEKESGIALVAAAPAVIKTLLALTPEYNKEKSKFNLNGIANYLNLYSSIANKAANVPGDIASYLKVLIDLYNETDNIQYKNFYDILLGNDNTIIYDNQSSDWTRTNILGAFFKALNLQKEDNVSVTFNSDGGDYVLSSYEISSSLKLKSLWLGKYIAQYNSQNTTEQFITAFNDAFDNIAKSGYNIEEAIVNAYSKLGVEINPDTVLISDPEEDIVSDKIQMQSKKVTYLELLEYMHSEINKSWVENKEVTPGIFSNNSPIKNELNKLLKAQTKFYPEITENSYLTGDGNLNYALKLNNFISNWTNVVNDINKKYRNSGERIKLLYEAVPMLNFPHYRDLSWVKQIVQNGNILRIVQEKELKTNNSATAVSINSWTFEDANKVYYKAVLDGRMPLIVPADRESMTEFVFETPDGEKVNNLILSEDAFVEKMLTYLNLEIQNSINYLTYVRETGNTIEYLGGTNVGDTMTSLRFFKDIITDKNVLKQIDKVINNPSVVTTPKDLISNNEEAISDNIRQWFAKAFEKEKTYLKDTNSLDTYKDLDTEKNFYYLFDSNIQDDSFNLDYQIKKGLFNHISSVAEQTALLIGDPGIFKRDTKNNNNISDIVKRIKLFNATRQNLNLSPSLVKWANTFYPNPIKEEDKRLEVKSFIANDVDYILSKEELVTIETNLYDHGILIGMSEESSREYAQNQLSVYKNIQSVDAAAYFNFYFMRDLLIFNNDWNDLKEEDFWLEIEGKPIKNKSKFGILKTQLVSGLPQLADYKFNATTSYKHAPLTLIPSIVKGTKLEALSKRINSKEGQTDIVQFASAVKFGRIKFAGQDANFSLESFNNIDTNKTQITPLSSIGIQQITKPKESNLVTAGKQFRTVIESNLYKNGKIIAPTKEEGARIERLIKDYLDASEEVVTELVKDALIDLGFEISINNTIVTNAASRQKLVDFILESSDDLNSNLKSNIEALKDKDTTLEYLQSATKIIAQILSAPRKATTNQKVPGTQSIMAPFEGFQLKSKDYNNTLLNYSRSEEDGSTLPAECYFQLTEDFEKLIGEGKKYKNIDELNADVEKSNQIFRNYHSKVKDESISSKLSDMPFSAEMLSIIGFRIPTQGYSSCEFLMIRKFLDKIQGDTIIVNPEITAKTGSDFDVDKLTMYLPKFSYEKGKIQVFKGNGYLTYFEDKIESLNKYIAFLKKNQRNWNKGDDISRKLLVSLFGDQYILDLKDKIKSNSDYIEYLEKNREKIIREVKNNYLFNNLFFSQIELLKIPSQLGNLQNPVTDFNLKKFNEDRKKLANKEKDNLEFSDLMLPSFNIRTHRKFLLGKKLLGVANNNMRSHVLGQVSGLQIGDYYSRIFFNHNKAEVTLLNSTTGQPFKYYFTNLAGTTDANEEFPILSILSEFVTAYVDIAKDPYIFDLNMNSQVIGTAMLLLRAGVSPRTVAFFVTQPVILEFNKLIERNQSYSRKVLGHTYSKKEIFKDVMKTYGDESFKKNIPRDGLYEIYNKYKNNKKSKFTVAAINQKLSEFNNETVSESNKDLEFGLKFVDNDQNSADKLKFNKIQRGVLELFLYYTEQAADLTSLTVNFKEDTLSLISFEEIKEQKNKQDTLLENNIFSGDSLTRYIYKSVLTPFAKANALIYSMLDSLSFVENNSRIKGNLDYIIEKLTRNNPGEYSFEKVSRIVKSSFLDFIVQNRFQEVTNVSKSFSQLAEDIMGKESINNISMRVLKIRENKKDKLNKNILIENLVPDFSRQKQTNLVLFDNKLSLYSSQQLINAYKEIKAIDQDLADDLLILNLAQSGFLFNKNSFLNLIDFETYNALMNRVFDFNNFDTTDFNFKEFYLLLLFNHPELAPAPGKQEIVYDFANEEWLNDPEDVKKHLAKIAAMEGKTVFDIRTILKKKEALYFVDKISFFETSVQVQTGYVKKRMPVKGPAGDHYFNIINQLQALINQGGKEGYSMAEIKEEKKKFQELYKKVPTKYWEFVLYKIKKVAGPEGFPEFIIDYTKGPEKNNSDSIFRTNMTTEDFKYPDNFVSDTEDFTSYEDVTNQNTEIESPILSIETSEKTIQSINKEIKPTTQPSTSVEIDFQEEPTEGYKNRTVKNASADATIALAYDFTSAGEKLTKSSVIDQNKKYIPLSIPKKTDTSDVNNASIKTQIDIIVNALNSVNAKTLNIAGNGIYTMKDAGWNQEEVDLMTYRILKGVLESPNLKNKIVSIRSGGQTGFDEAGAKAGIMLGIPTSILAPKGWKFRNESGTDISNEQQFKARFNNNQPSSSVKPTNDINALWNEYKERILAKHPNVTEADLQNQADKQGINWLTEYLKKCY